MTEETQEPEQVAQVQEEVVNTEVQTAQEAPKPQPKSVDDNWANANQVLKLQKQKIEELEERLSKINAPAPVVEKDEFADLDPEEYMTVRDARKLAENLATKKAAEAARQEVQRYAQEQNIQSDEARTRSKYEDYDYVLENYAIPLIKNDPALAYRVQNSKNPAETAYKLGKLSDSYEETMATKQTSPKAEKILKNSSRPVSSHAAGSPLKNQADQFSKMSKQETWELSQKYARGA